MLRFAATQDCAAFPVPKIVICSSLTQMVGALSGIAACAYVVGFRKDRAWDETRLPRGRGGGERWFEVSERLLPGSLKISHMRIEQLKKRVLNFGV